MLPVFLIFVVEFGAEQSFFFRRLPRKFQDCYQEGDQRAPFSNYQCRARHRHKQTRIERVPDVCIRTGPDEPMVHLKRDAGAPILTQAISRPDRNSGANECKDDPEVS